MEEIDPGKINSGVVAAPFAKQQTGLPGYCLLSSHRNGEPFTIGQKCGQCPTVATGQREITISGNPDFKCLCMAQDNIKNLEEKGIVFIWVDGYPSQGSSELPAPPAVQA